MNGRGQAATWFEDASGALLVDCGPSFMAHANRFGVDLERLRAVAITHFHGDHLAGLPFLLMHFQSIARRTRPLDLLGPAGLKGHLDALCALMYDRWGFPFPLRVHEWDPAGALAPWDNTHWLLTPHAMQHKPESLGFRLQTAETTVAFTGDTVLCPALFALARGADVLVVECTLPTPIVPIHIHARELVEALPDLHARRVAAIHTDDATAASAVAAGPDGRLPDGLFFPADGESWEL
jgi:ribonuclease BN (tRNA processing enzyme)